MAGIFLAIVLLCVYFYFDPSDHFFPRCPFLTMTGLECPGCGSQRAIHALLHGDLASVWHYNAALFLFIPMLIVLFVAELLRRRYPRFHDAVNSTWVVIATGVAIVLWWVLRNAI